jgi:hypothetical protein
MMLEYTIVQALARLGAADTASLINRWQFKG